MTAIRDVLRALVLAKARFVVVGGVAVVLHGHIRATKDLDLVIDLAPDEARKALAALRNAGLMPMQPVDPLTFADPETRRAWIEEKNMIVFQMRSNVVDVDLFVDYPIDFEALWNDSQLLVIEDVTVRVASIPHLIEMKEKAGREVDHRDIEILRKLERLDGKGPQ